MKWEELIAAARAAGFLKFAADGIAVLEQEKPASTEQKAGTPNAQ
jgi:hypothetical protein